MIRRSYCSSSIHLRVFLIPSIGLPYYFASIILLLLQRFQSNNAFYLQSLPSPTIVTDSSKHHLARYTGAVLPVIQITTTTTTTTTTAKTKTISPSVLRSKMSDRDEEALSRARNDARTDIRNLLTQRSIQSFLFLCTSVRDPHSVKWIEDFLDAHDQLNFHGSGAAYLEAFGGTWDAPLMAMMEEPKDVVVVSAKRTGKGHKGWSKNNPYLEDRYVEFEIDIDPVSLTSRILSVREQIANEWVADLDVLSQANDAILGSYFKLAKEERSKAEDPIGRQEAELPTTIAFERTALNILENNINFQSGATASSPFRKGNFDLLYNLCTQASVHRLLREYREDVEEGIGMDKEANAISFAWLRDFYTSRVEEYFDGNQRYGRADDFIEQLLLSSPSVKYTDHGKFGLADPMGMAEAIISKRREIADEWKVVMSNVPQDHADGIRRTLLTKQMESWGSGSSFGEGFQ